MPVDNRPTHQVIMRNSEYDVIGLYDPIPEGWKDTSTKGTYRECRDWVDRQRKPFGDKDRK